MKNLVMEETCTKLELSRPCPLFSAVIHFDFILFIVLIKICWNDECKYYAS